MQQQERENDTKMVTLFSDFNIQSHVYTQTAFLISINFSKCI